MKAQENQSEYKHVYWKKSKVRKHSCWQWHKIINGTEISKSGFKTDREAALHLDKALIDRGLEPINILIRKK